MSVRGFSLVASASAMLAGCQTVSSPSPGIPDQLTSTQVTFIQDGVRRELKDPFSAVFGELKAVRHPDNTFTVCGAVNAKNSFGGYIGDNLFIGQLKLSTFTVKQISNSEGTLVDVFEDCKKAGVYT
jgi:hypothetical protein